MKRDWKALVDKNYILVCYIFAFVLIHVAMTDNFPFVHSDEPWLSGLTRNMLENKSIGVTETFFDAYPRSPHAIKVVFHIMQMPFMKIFGYDIFSFRLLSIIAGAAFLMAFYRACIQLTGDKAISLWTCALMGLDIQFTYASGFARQEIVIALIQICLVLMYIKAVKRSGPPRKGAHLAMGALCGIGAGVHPNSFIIAVSMGLAYVYDIFKRRLKPMDLACFGSMAGAVASIFVFMSFAMNRGFVSDYSAYGQTLGAGDSIFAKIEGIVPFYKKLYLMQSGTYYTPDIRGHLMLFALLVAVALIMNILFKGEFLQGAKSDISRLLLMVFGINAGYIAIGRYNQTSIIFIFPLMYLVLACILNNVRRRLVLGGRLVAALLTLAVAFQAVHSYGEIRPYIDHSYDDYMNELSKALSPGDMTFGNLNAEYFFENGKLLDYRNLYYVKKSGKSIEDYMEEKGIEYIVYLEELDYINKTSPMWDAFYGDPSLYYEELNSFIDSRCIKVYSFEDDFYGNRIARYVGKSPWNVSVYKVR